MTTGGCRAAQGTRVTAEMPIYLDHNATTPILPAVVDAMLPYLREHFGNPSSGHVYGRRARDAVEQTVLGAAALREQPEGEFALPCR